jgi:Transposase DDE domain
LVVAVREQMAAEAFKNRHRRATNRFERQRKLPFMLILILILRKSAKGLQTVLNEISGQLGNLLVTASAFSQARQQLSHTAFIELNQRTIQPFCYADDDHQRYRGYRVLAGDGSRLRLPEHESVRATFGALAYTSGKDAQVEGTYACGQAYVLHDVLNKVVIDAHLAAAKTAETTLAITALATSEAQDLLLYDRNFACYELLAHHIHQQRHFVIRCSKSSFQTARDLFQADQEASRQVTLQAPPQRLKMVRRLGLPRSVRVRFVAVRLETGELEVLVTSLLDELAFPSSDFKAIYHLRWGVETLFDVLKTRLALENFSGKTAVAVQQEFHATIFLTGLESLLTAEADDLLALRSADNQLGQTVNNMVSFAAIKQHALDLLLTEPDPTHLLRHLTDLFLLNPTYTRRNRRPPRRRISDRAAINFWRYRRKVCF